jgi:lipoprotein-releasing system permease protein
LNYQAFIAKKVLSGNSSGKSFARPIVQIAIGGIALGIGVMLITVSIVRGFQAEIKYKVIGFGGHIIVSGYTNNNSFEMEPVLSNAGFLKTIRNNPEIKTVSPFALKNGMLSNKSENEGVILKGYDKSYNMNFFKIHLKQGLLPDFSNDSVASVDVLLSEMLAKRMSLKCGEKINVGFLTQGKKGNDAYEARTRIFKISGIYSTGLEEFDAKTLIVDLRHIQRINYWGDSLVGGFELQVKHLDKLENTANWVYENSGDGIDSKSIKEVYPGIFGWLDLMDSNAVIVIVLMIIVAVINMISALLILVLENVQMIGILKAMGCSNQNVKRIFLIQSVRLTIRGLIFGNLFGLLLLFVQHHFKIIRLSQESYYMPYVPVSFEWTLFLILNLCTFMCCLFALYLPGTLISRVHPLRSIRFR